MTRPRGGWRSLALAALALASCGRPPAPDVPPGTGGTATAASSPIALAPDGLTLWVANPDADSVTPVDTSTFTAGAPVPVGDEPWGVAVAPTGTVLVLNRGSGSLSFLDGGRRDDLVVGAEPGGVALSPDGTRAYVTVSSEDVVAVVDVAARRIVRRVPVGRLPWALTVVDDARETVVITHRLARLRPDGREGTNSGKEGRLTVLRGGEVVEAALPPHAFGYPNALESVVHLPGAAPRAVVAHVLNSPEPPNDFQTTVSAGLSVLDLETVQERAEGRLHLNDPDFSTPVSLPRALAASPDGSRLYVALAGSNAVMGIAVGAEREPALVGFWPAGASPRGIAVDAGGRRAYVMNHLSRDVSVLDLTDPGARREIARIVVVPETLDPEVARGAVLFHHAADPRVSRGGWMACASCHHDGGVDGTTWHVGEGPRQTMPLWALDGTAPFHVAGTRDELQDFEADIEGLMGGLGLAAGRANPLLGAPSAGASADLDALAAYVLRGVRVPRAPNDDALAVARGRARFEAAGCAGCHGGPVWTTSRLPGAPGTLDPAASGTVEASLRDVGTFDPAVDRTGALGFDPPSLLGLHASAPYLHAGDASSLSDLLAHPEHPGPLLHEADRADVAAFLRSIDATTAPVRTP